MTDRSPGSSHDQTARRAAQTDVLTDRPLTVALSGASGYIASHVAVALIERGHRVVGFDNLSNSSPIVVDRIAAITGVEMAFAQLDIRDVEGVEAFLTAHKVETLVHFAGLKAVGDSIERPLEYYDNNVAGTVSLLMAMRNAGVEELVFSSSATVYNQSAESPLVETAPLGPINPYGRTKLMIEEILSDVAASSSLRVVNLRYFNPVGAHPSGLIGEDPIGPPNNLMPFVMQVAVGRRPELRIFGDDYPTPDGTCIRDYIHVCDLADGHVAAVEHAAGFDDPAVINLGTGVGTSVKEALAASEQAVGHAIPHSVVGRRDGDGAVSFADPSRAAEVLGWKARRSFAEACVDHWRWQRQNPAGYDQPVTED